MLKTTTAFTKIGQLTKRTRLIAGGTRAGKSYAILQYLILYALNKELRIFIVGYTSDMLENGVYKDFIKILNDLNYYDNSKHNLTRKIYKLNKSTFKFITGEDPLKLKGVDSDIVYFNECNLLTFDSFNELNGRCRLFTICDWNPSAKFWADKYLIGKDNVDFITLTYKDNEFLEQTLIDEIESWEVKGLTDKYYANRWRVMGLGLLGIQEGVIYTNWSEIDYIPDDAVLLGSGMDFGYANDPSALISFYDYNGEILVDEKIFQTGLDNPQLAKLILNTDARHGVIYADNEPKSIAEIKQFGINIIRAAKNPGSINYGIQLVQQKHLKVTKRSTNLIKELLNYTWAKDRLGEPTNEPIKIYNHALDALRYFFLMKFSKRKTKSSLRWKH